MDQKRRTAPAGAERKHHIFPYAIRPILMEIPAADNTTRRQRFRFGFESLKVVPFRRPADGRPPGWGTGQVANPGGPTGHIWRL